MKQAIQENFILDVLKNYMTYKTYFHLGKSIKDDPNYPSSKANKALGKYLSLHPHNLRQKAEIMIEHFRTKTKNEIGGRAKAMLVCGSRLHAVRYYYEFERYIKDKNYDDKIFVAFSGTVLDKGDEYTEIGITKLKKVNCQKNSTMMVQS